MKFLSFFSKFNKSLCFRFLLDLSVVLLSAVFIFLLTPLYFDHVMDFVSFGLGFFFCMISDCIFSVLSHHLRKAYYYRHFSQPERAHFITWEDYKNGKF